MFLPFYDAKVQQLFLADVQFCAVLENQRLFDAIELRVFMRRGRGCATWRWRGAVLHEVRPYIGGRRIEMKALCTR